MSGPVGRKTPRRTSKKILDGYNQSQTKVVAKHVVVPENMTQKLLARVAAGNPPSTAVVFGATIAYQLAAQKALLALDEIGKPDQVATLKKWMLPAIWDLGVYDGKFYYATMWNQCMGTFVNTKMCKEQGVDPTKPPATLEELDAICDKLTTYDAQGNIDVLGGDFTWDSMIWAGSWASTCPTTARRSWPMIRTTSRPWSGGRSLDEDGRQKLQDFYASLAGRGERSAGNDPFLSGLRATLVTGPWQFDTLKRYKQPDFEFTVWPFPGPAGVAKRACTPMATAGSSRRAARSPGPRGTSSAR